MHFFSSKNCISLKLILLLHHKKYKAYELFPTYVQQDRAGSALLSRHNRRGDSAPSYHGMD